VSAISGISLSPLRQRLGLYFRLHLDNIKQVQVAQFLGYLLRHLRGNVIALLDNSKTHRGPIIRKLLHRHRRLQLEYFPPYAPDLNPDEGVWSLGKRALANFSPGDVTELLTGVADALHEIGSSQANLRGCIAHSELPSFLR
jgi:transposase